jgi:pimeloyl-ACP methyl ester carboxylesterase
MAFYPQEIGQNGVLSPIVIWGNGATVTSPTVYGTLLNHIASHGFAVLAYNTTPQGSDMTAAIDWMVAENTRQGSTFYGTLDTSKIAAMGHSAGSLAAFAIANDPRLTTTMHLDGGTMSPHTDLQNLRQPAAFICGDSGGDGLVTGDVARPNCDSDFMMATTAVWYGDVIGASHLTVASAPATDPKMQAFLGATAAWLRWQLASDQTMKPYFVPASTCTFCTQTSIWTVQEKNL